jgi:hypothetical protein
LKASHCETVLVEDGKMAKGKKAAKVPVATSTDVAMAQVDPESLVYWPDLSKEQLEALGRALEPPIELDRRKSLEDLRAQVRLHIEESPWPQDKPLRQWAEGLGGSMDSVLGIGGGKFVPLQVLLSDRGTPPQRELRYIPLVRGAKTGPSLTPTEAPARVNPVVREETAADVDRRRAAGEIA